MTIATRRLPGFRFEDHTPARDVLPRMDIALFAGFARRGPVNLAVAIEDTAQFEAIFGGVTPLAFDLETRRPVVAQLAPAVRLFFANGGRRCWVVRLADKAKTNTFRLPGVLSGALQPMRLQARSPGSWSDAVTVSASLSSRRIAAVSGSLAAAGNTLDVVSTPSAPLRPGDLLRLQWDGAGVEAYVAVATVTRTELGRARVVVSGDLEWFDLDRHPLNPRGTATLANGAVATVEIEPQRESPGEPDRDISLLVHVAPADAPRPGDVFTATFDRDRLYFSVRDVADRREEGSPLVTMVRVVGRGRWQRPAASPTPPGVPIIECLTVDVWAREGGAPAQRIDAADLFDGTEAERFPLAGFAAAPLCVPFGVTAWPEFYLPAEIPPGTALERDGLVPFDASLFIDPALAGALASTLVTDAEFIRHLATHPRALRGIHAALAVDEISIIAVPDAAQPGWTEMAYVAPFPPEKSESIARDTCPADDFIDCGAIVGQAPELAGRPGTSSGTIELEWMAVEIDTTFIVEESTSRDWRGSIVVFEGADIQATLHGRRPGDYYYRVRGVGDHPTEWSNGVSVQVLPAAGWSALGAGRYADDVLLAVHRALLRLCAARRDVMAVLSVPAHYREETVAAHVERLGSVRPEPAARGSLRDKVMVTPLSLGEADALGFGALYHGWMYSRDNESLALVCPDGPACGALARRARQRGAWVAPANEPLRGIVALHRAAPPAAWESLQDLQINVTRAHANGFLMLSADTLARDSDVRPINVRRLLMLLRRMATQLGADFVFEPNDASLRRMVQRRFEAMLGEMFERGAFAGATAQSAFQVVTDQSLNTRQSLDLGRFIVELRVAPSRPLSFLTLRLVQTGERLSVTGA